MDRLLQLLKERSFQRQEVTLTSGRKSNFFIDCKQTVLTAEGHVLVGQALTDAAFRLENTPVAVAGVELGGCPLASAVALISAQRGTPLDAIYVRKAAKDHGTMRWLEGDSTISDGASVAVVEDVITTGGSTLNAVQRLRDRGLNIAGVIALVDRLEGGANAIKSAGIELISIYTRRDFTDSDA